MYTWWRDHRPLAGKCPKKVDDEYNEGLGKRKAVYVPYSQAVPLKYAFDDTICLKLTKNRCGNCEKVCPSGAINFADKAKNKTLNVGSIILAMGFESFDWCSNAYCSSVCCMYAVKQAVMARDCSRRALNLLYTWDQLNPENIETLTVNCCPSSLTSHGDCFYLKPKTTGEYKKAHGIDYNDSPKDFMADHDSQDRLSRWMYEFQKCIKCYGCRNVCPVCFCKECSLEHPNLVEPGVLPAEVPIFHNRKNS
jgi:ferredoxin